MDSDTDSYFEEHSESEEQIAGPIHINLNIEESPESPPPGSPSPAPAPPAPISVGEVSPSGNCQTTGQTSSNILFGQMSLN